jgi:hypothetical protein
MLNLGHAIINVKHRKNKINVKFKTKKEEVKFRL